MVNIFWDWTRDFVIILTIFIIFLVYYFFINRERKASYKFGFLASLLILLISGSQFLGVLVFDDNYLGPTEGLWITGIIFFISILTTIKSGFEFYLEHEKK